LGGEGLDSLIGGEGRDTLRGGDGDDIISPGSINPGVLQSGEVYDGGAGTDSLQMVGYGLNGGGDYRGITLSSIEQFAFQGSGGLRLTYFDASQLAPLGNLSVIGSPGGDAIQVFLSETNNTFDFRGWVFLDFGQNLDYVAVVSSLAADAIFASNSAKMSAFGYEGNDTILGGDQDDNIGGGTGIDEIRGGAGNDTLDARGLVGGTPYIPVVAGDFFDGGAGLDTLLIDVSADFRDAVLSSIEQLRFFGPTATAKFSGAQVRDAPSPDFIVFDDSSAGDAIVLNLEIFASSGTNLDLSNWQLN
jgi:Ca2+-binding RTX toxin-like protein